MKSIYLFSFLFLLLMGCSNTDQNMNNPEVIKSNTPTKLNIMPTKPAFIHTVFFWLKEGVNAVDKKRFNEELKKLGTVPSIQSVYWGPPAMTPRDVVDNSYDIAWVVHFESKEKHELYQKDQIHLDFIEACKDLWENVQVYDNLVN